jgi:hypothetical protein
MSNGWQIPCTSLGVAFLVYGLPPSTAEDPSPQLVTGEEGADDQGQPVG